MRILILEILQSKAAILLDIIQSHKFRQHNVKHAYNGLTRGRTHNGISIVRAFLFSSQIRSLSCPSLLDSGKYSDLTITCGSKSYPVHRALLATRSSFFDGACRNPFRESETGIIDLTEDDPEAVEHMVNCTRASLVNP